MKTTFLLSFLYFILFFFPLSTLTLNNYKWKVSIVETLDKNYTSQVPSSSQLQTVSVMAPFSFYYLRVWIQDEVTFISNSFIFIY